MSESHNVLGLDVGDRRIGVALASLEARLPKPLTTIDRLKVSNALESIQDICQQEKVAVIVVGLPRGMSGQETGQTAQARAFAEEVAKATGLDVVMQDEAGTSLAAEDELKSRGRIYEKGDIDALAAALILQDWLIEQPQEARL